MAKSISIRTNDARFAKYRLSIFGSVKNFAIIKPGTVHLSGRLGKLMKKTVTIIPKKEYPFSVLEATAMKGANISFHLERKMAEDGPGYLLVIENVMQKLGKYYDTITLKTDSHIRPKLKIRVHGNIMAPKQTPRQKTAQKKPDLRQQTTD